MGFTLYLFKTTIANSEDYLLNIARLTASQVDDMVDNMDNLALQIIANPTITEGFVTASRNDGADNYFDYDVKLRTAMRNVLASLNGPNISADRINLSNGKGDYLSIGVFVESGDHVNRFLKSPAYDAYADAILSKKGRMHLIPPSTDHWSDIEGQLLFAVSREVRDLHSSYGVIEVQRKYTYLDDIFTAKAQPEDLGVYMVEKNDQGLRTVYPYTPESAADAIPSTDYFQAILAAGSKVTSMVSPLTGNREIVVSVKLNHYDWYVIFTQPYGEFLREVFVTILLMVLITLFLFMATSLLIYMISRRLTRPIHSLIENVNGIHHLDNMRALINKSETSIYKDEFEQLDNSFKKLSKRLEYSTREIVALKTREINAQFLALQAQINPHFLYNTLAVINASAIEEDFDKTSDLCTRLSEMLRYSTSFDEERTTLHDELNHSRSYLELMKARYEDRLHYTLHYDPDFAKTLTLPKLTLQPIIENAFSHGFKGKKPPWHISIDVSAEDGHWCIEIYDNGIGFEPGKLESLNQKLDDYFQAPTEQFTTLHIGGLALLNTLIRLKHFYGDSFTFDVDSNAHSGTTIKIGGPL